MNRKLGPGFDLSPPLIRKAFAIVAFAATLAVALFIDALAHGYGTSAPLYVQHAPMVVAQR